MSKFKAGEVHNPNGRPVGTGHRQQAFNALVMPHKEALFNKAIELALAGNEPMLRLFLERMMPPKPTYEPIPLQLPLDPITLESFKEIGENALRSLERGENTAQQVKSIFDILKGYFDNVAIHELNNKAKLLEEKFNKYQEQPSWADTK